MHYSVYAGIAFAAVFGAIAPWIARRVAPATATWLLSVGGAIAALSGIACLSALAMTLIAQNPTVAARGEWSISVLRQENPVRWPVALAALAALVACLVRLAWVASHRVRRHRVARQLNRAVADTGTDLVIVSSTAVDAYAVPGSPGRIFVTRGMLALLSEPEFAVMLAHERAHLRRHHHRHRTVADLSHALNPLLRALPPTQEWVTERWADEVAARDSRRAVLASALRRAADSATDQSRPHAALALSCEGIDGRVAAMFDEPPRRRPLMLAVAATVLALSVYGTLDGLLDEAALFNGAAGAAVSAAHSPHLASPTDR
jgi:Peptidase family M48